MFLSDADTAGAINNESPRFRSSDCSIDIVRGFESSFILEFQRGVIEYFKRKRGVLPSRGEKQRRRWETESRFPLEKGTPKIHFHDDVASSYQEKALPLASLYNNAPLDIGIPRAGIFLLRQ